MLDNNLIALLIYFPVFVYNEYKQYERYRLEDNLSGQSIILFALILNYTSKIISTKFDDKKSVVYIQETFWTFLFCILYMVWFSDGFYNWINGDCNLIIEDDEYCWRELSCYWCISTIVMLLSTLYIYELFFLGKKIRSALSIHHITHLSYTIICYFDINRFKLSLFPIGLALFEQFVFISAFNNKHKFVGKWIYIIALVQFVFFKIYFVIMNGLLFFYNLEYIETIPKIGYFFAFLCISAVQIPTILAILHMYKKK